MRSLLGTLFLIIAFALFSDNVKCQTAWYYQWGLLPDKTIDYLIGESSGEQAYNTIADLSEFNRQRKPEEFQGTLFESQYVIDRLKEYGLEGVNIERFGKTKSYHPLKGDLWELSPHSDKIADVTDLPFTLVPGSPVTETDGELVYIGDAYNGTLDKIDLSGKIALTSARPGAIMNMMLQKGARGIVSFYSPRPLENEIMIPDMKGGGASRNSSSSLFVFDISPRDGYVIRDRLLRGEKIKVHASIKFRTEEIDIQVPTCFIKGSDPDAGEIIISAHLFESFINEGANDNISGAAAILEVARVLNKAVTEGIISRPKRTIRFIWVPEYSGTIPWVKAHKDIVRESLCNINLDMVGLSLSKYKSSMILHRTTYGNAHYINDVVENYYRYVGETNQKNSVVTGSTFFKRIVAPSGTEDPFYYQIETSSGGSDHDVFNDWGVQVPGVLLITWPDPFYHTSQDRIDKCDPTQLKRVVFITSAAAFTIASAGEGEAINISGEVYGNSVRRIGYQVSKAFDEINKAGADNLVHILKRSISDIRGTSLGEIMTINSIAEISPGSTRLKDILKEKCRSVADLAGSVIENLTRTAALRATDFGMPEIDIQPSKEEKRAQTIVPIIVTDPRDLGYEGYNQKIKELPEDVRNMYAVTGVYDPYDAAACINGKNSILDIKNILDAQDRSETDLLGLINFFSRLKAAGFIKF
jgi:aminopeptidase YwaD